MIRKIVHSMLALTLAVGIAASTYQPAEARHGRGVAIGIAAGIIGLGIAGAYAHGHRHHHHHHRSCYAGRERCGWTDRHCYTNRYGDYVCRGGRYTCWRPTICD